MKQIYTWANQFHNTTAKSTLNKQEVEDTEKGLRSGHINSKHKDARKLKRLFDKLCPHKFDDCSCKFMMHQLKL